MKMEIKKANGSVDLLQRKQYLEKIELSVSTETLRILSLLTASPKVDDKVKKYEGLLKKTFRV